MANDKKESIENDIPAVNTVQPIPKVSKIIIDEATGTLTLKLASEEEIAEDEKMKKEKGPESK